MFIRTMFHVLTLTVILTAPGLAYGGKPEYGGQTVEVQAHHLEFVAEPTAQATHLHLYILDPQDKKVTNAGVKLQILSPDGLKTALALKYNVQEASYVGDLPLTVKGVYKVVALTTIGGKKLNARYTFKR
ncbi:hypothetical protein [Candidatus Cyanaurora vandensis]|uniref:hypothetical protein n=1 Tax=Candidatus Cyanaurora vandensis TaxID=2714958 RepID=UPI00257CAAED|nr:hypothetical protein [Candidatus Cyanaurora vandensis]